MLRMSRSRAAIWALSQFPDCSLWKPADRKKQLQHFCLASLAAAVLQVCCQGRRVPALDMGNEHADEDFAVQDILLPTYLFSTPCPQV